MNRIVFYYCLAILLSSCVDNDRQKNEKATSSRYADSIASFLKDKRELPFVGVRYFETRLGITGTGTPHTSVEIKIDGTVIFAFIQINQADKTISEGSYNAGVFRKNIECVFDIWDDETRFYNITSERIYEVDSNGAILKSLECCPHLEETECACEGELSLTPL